MKKKLLSLAMTVAMILVMTPAAHAATYEYPVDGGNLKFDPITGTITDCDFSVYSANIPEEIYGIPVTAIGDRAFEYCSKLASVTIPSTVTSIGCSAFRYCSNLTSVTIPSSVTSFEKDGGGWSSAFNGCSKLESITIPGSIKELPKGLFRSCKALKSVTLGEGVERIEYYVFYDCDSLEEIVLPDSVKEVAREAFYSCDELQTVTFGSGVNFIDKNAFSNCPRLEAMYFRGAAPGTGGSIANKYANGFMIYYPAGASGWGEPTWNGFIAKPYTPSGYEEPVPPTTPTPTPTPTPAVPSTGMATAIPTASTVLVDGVSVAFDAYNINGNNYFKLRDLAFILSGSQVQFEVSWDASANAIRMTSGASYTPVGGEMSSRGKINQVASPTASAVLLDGSSITLTAYNIGGNNYFKLRDIGSAFNFGVEWDGVQNMILIDTTKPYTA